MALDEHTRELVYRALEPVVGEEAAAVISRELPGADVATKADLDALEERTDRRFEQVDRRFEQVDRRFEVLEARMEGRFEGLDARVVSLEERMVARFELVEGRMDALRAELLAAFRGELVSAVVGQTRMMIFALVGAFVAVGGLALSLARFA